MRGPKETARDLAFDRAAVAKRRYARSQRAFARVHQSALGLGLPRSIALGALTSGLADAKNLAKLAQDLADRAQTEYEQSEEFNQHG